MKHVRALTQLGPHHVLIPWTLLCRLVLIHGQLTTLHCLRSTHLVKSQLSFDLFSSGVIKSATDFHVYKEDVGLSRLDFSYTDNSGVYHTKHTVIN
ncbi:uncharacterized protein [Euphorbia lathyris]|uniref:uncharacterized protein isoform X2 n=1 Tax=Euphorbia lathyris TaxID=212925 RepID=UPI003313471A